MNPRNGSKKDNSNIKCGTGFAISASFSKIQLYYSRHQLAYNWNIFMF